MRTIITTVFLTLALASSAFASTFPFDINAFEAHQNGQNKGVAASYSLHVDNHASSDFSTWAIRVDLTKAIFNSMTQNNCLALNNAYAARIHKLTNFWVVPQLNIEQVTKTLLFSLNDTGSGNSDHNLTLATLSTAPPVAPPVAGLALLLGSGLMGLVGLRRSHTS